PAARGPPEDASVTWQLLRWLRCSERSREAGTSRAVRRREEHALVVDHTLGWVQWSRRSAAPAHVETRNGRRADVARPGPSLSPGRSADDTPRGSDARDRLASAHDDQPLHERERA